MASRPSKGCLACRTRKVKVFTCCPLNSSCHTDLPKCDEGRPACNRCVQRGELCTGYRDVTSLFFRNETEKTVRRSLGRRASLGEVTASDSSERSHSSGRSARSRATDNSLSSIELPTGKLSKQYLWAKDVPRQSLPTTEERAVSKFFDQYVLYPCNHGSSPGFLEHLPSLFKTGFEKGRMALRWAVRAASLAGLASETDDITLRSQALQCYGTSLSCLGESLAGHGKDPDDYDLMTVVILDIFETVYLDDPIARGSHAEGMAQILRLRGPNQIYSARGWSLFRLAHHRLVR